MTSFLQHVINGIIIGGTYSMMGVGLTLIFGVMKVVNFAHGEFYMLAAFFLFTFLVLVGLPLSISIGAALGALVIVAFLCERYLLRPIRNLPMESNMILMIGVSILLQHLALIIWGGTPKNVPLPFTLTSVPLGPLVLTPLRLAIALVAVTSILSLGIFLNRSTLGKAIRATFQDREMAMAVGIKIDRIYNLVFIIGALFAGLAGILLAPIYVVLPTMGILVTNKSFAVAIAGGLGNFPGAIYAGLILGVGESLAAAYISSGYKDAVAFILLIVILLWSPKWIRQTY
ncbi:branched-chain amino acid ABC transporter permease [Moorellaceae bacterium AZ2]